MKKFTSLIILLVIFSAIPIQFISAIEEISGFYFDISEQNGKRGQNITLSINYDGDRQDIGAFAVTIEYDNYNFEYSKVEAGDKIKSNYYTTKSTDNIISSVFTTKSPNHNVNISGNVFRYTFKVKSDAETGASGFKIKIEQTVSNEADPVETDYEETLLFYVMPLPEEDSNLYELIPAKGNLRPSFSPDIYEYNLSVPYEVKSLDFRTKTADTSNVRVNRTNLGAGGSEVDFIFTVTAENKSYTSKYTVSVTREEKVTENNGSSASAKSASSKTTSSSKSSSTSKSSTNSSSKQEKTTSSKSTNNNKVSSRAKIIQGVSSENEEGHNSKMNSSTNAIIIQSDSFKPFLIGVISAITCIAAVMGIVLIIRKKDKENKNNDDKE